MILLDTNVVSENFRPHPAPVVVAWIDSQEPRDLYLCSPVLAELRFGAERLPAGRAQDHLRRTIDQIEDAFDGRVLQFDAAAAAQYGQISAKRERMGRPMGQMDALIAAIALVEGASLATRDVSGFSDVGLALINPFAIDIPR